LEVGQQLGLPSRPVQIPCEQCNACAHGALPRRDPRAPRWPPTGPPPAARHLAFPAPGNGAPGSNAGVPGPTATAPHPTAAAPREVTGAHGPARGAADGGRDPATAPPDAAMLRIIMEELARELARR